MKKIMKFSKIFLVLVTIFSQLSSVATVFADEITTKPLILTLEQLFDEDNVRDHYELTYISERNDYEETEVIDDALVDKTYDIKLVTKFTYLNDETEEKDYLIEDVTGKTLNNTRSSYKLDPISKFYDGLFEVNIKVLDGDNVIYEEDIPYVVNNSYKGLVGSLNVGEVLPTSEEVNLNTKGEYGVTIGKEYTQSLMLMPGELSPSSTYKFVYKDGTKSEEVTGEEILGTVIEGTTTDLTDKLYGKYSYTDEVTLEEVKDDEIINTYKYSYSSIINYGNSQDNDTLFNRLYGIYGLLFKNGYVILNAKNLYGTDNVIKISELADGVVNYGIALEVYDENGNVLDLTDENVLSMEVKNGYKLRFVNGAEAIYTVVVKGDNTFDNVFDSNDMLPTIDNYLNSEINMSMDMFSNNDEEENGKISFEDVMYINELLKDNGNIQKEEEDNTDLSLYLSDIPSEIFVGDTFKLSLVIKNSEINDYIDGINGIITTNDSLKVVDYTFNNKLIGKLNEDGRFAFVGNALSEDGTVVMTVTFMAVMPGTGSVTVKGETAKYLNIDKFDDMSKEINIVRKISTNNYLASLNASVGTFDIDFDKDVTVYTLTVPYNTESVILSGALDDIYSSAEGLIEYKLTDDKTTANIVVTAEDGSIRVYTVYIIKEAKPTEVKPITYYYSSNNYLKLLEVAGYEIEFDKEIDEYQIKVNSDVASLEIKAIAEDSRARVEITGNENFKKGENIVTITVTAENGETREYKLIVNKDAEKKEAVTEIDDSSNTAEKIVIIVLIILVVLGLLYLIFKKDDEEIPEVEEKKSEVTKKNKTDVTKNKKNKK
ncbi:MAG: cadherin-like beta sandwich domain-containing protein [Bacilli bacterium]